MIVTGASRGIGAATAVLAAQRGYAVCVNYERNREQAESVVSEINSQQGKAIAVQADIGKPQEVERLFETVDKKLGSLSALVNNAGIAGPRGELRQMDVDVLQRVFDVNVLGYFFCARQAIRRFAFSQGGRGGGIVNISSQAAQFGGNRITPYAASKAAINTFTIGLAREVAEENIRVNAVSPGIIETDQQKALDPSRRKELIESIPMKRAGDPDEVAATILWLLSDKASYVTGAIIPVAGGR